MKDIILVGFGGHAKSIADSIEQTGEYRIVGYTEQRECDTSGKYDYLGTDDVLKEYFSKGVKYAAICVGYLGKGTIRNRLYSELKTIGFELPVIIDPSAILAKKVFIGEGTFIGKGAVINAEARVDEMCIINTKALIEHECRVEPFVHVAVGATLCGSVTVKQQSFIGANSTIIQGVTIGQECVVGAGAIVLKDVQEGKIICGVYKG